MRVVSTVRWLLITGAMCLIWGASPAGAQTFVSAAARIAAAPGGQPLQLLLPLKADDPGLSRFAGAVSDPSSPLYGKYESVPELARRFGASASVRQRVIRFLRSHGATSVHLDATGMFAYATLSVAAAQRLFAAPLATFAAAGSRFVAPVSAPHVPSGLRGLVDGVVGLNTRPVAIRPEPRFTAGRQAALRPALPWARPSSGQPSSAYFPGHGDTIRVYGRQCTAAASPPTNTSPPTAMSPLRSAGFAGAGERVALIEIDGFKYSDLTTFARCFRDASSRRDHLPGGSEAGAPTRSGGHAGSRDARCVRARPG